LRPADIEWFKASILMKLGQHLLLTDQVFGVCPWKDLAVSAVVDPEDRGAPVIHVE